MSVSDTNRVQAAALDYLATRARTVAEMQRYLEKKFPDHEAISVILDWLCSRHYLDDAAFAKEFVRQRVSLYGFGAHRIRGELVRKGIAPSVVDGALAGEEIALEQVASALTVGTRRWQILERESDQRKRRKKLADFLLRRGYSFDVVRRVVEQCSGTLDETD